MQMDATWYIKNVWRRNKQSGKYELKEINWTEHELPNGLSWHMQHFKETLKH